MTETITCSARSRSARAPALVGVQPRQDPNWLQTPAPALSKRCPERCRPDLTFAPGGHNILVMSPVSYRRTKRRTADRRSIAAAEFKARCLELMDRVRETGIEYVVTKHGEPVAKLTPYVAGDRPAFFGSMKG